MNSIERIQAVLAGERPDWVPIVPKISFANVIACEDMHVRDYMTSGETMARACVSAYRMFGWDGVSLQTDIGNEGKALGSLYEQPEDEPSKLVRPFLASCEPEELEKVKVPDVLTTKPFSIVLDAVRRVKAEIGREVYVIAWTNGPLNVAGQLLGVEELLVSLLTCPDELKKLLEKCTDVACRYAQELVKVGAQAIAFGHATASSSVISADAYREFALPYERRLVAGIHECGAAAITHICGDILPIIDDIRKNGSEIIDFDHVCDLSALRQHAPDRVFRGNIDPTLLALGSPGEIREKVRNLLSGPETWRNLLLGTGCEVTTNTPAENLRSFVEAGREFGVIKTDAR